MTLIAFFLASHVLKFSEKHVRYARNLTRKVQISLIVETDVTFRYFHYFFLVKKTHVV